MGWDRLAAEISLHGELWLAEGRLGLLREAIGKLPDTSVQSSSRLSRLLAAATSVVNPLRARQLSERAYDLASSEGLISEQFLAISAVIESYLPNFSDYKGIEVWGERMATALFADVTRQDLAWNLRVEGLSAFLLAAVYAMPHDKRIPVAAREIADAICTGELSSDLCLKVGNRLLTYSYITKDLTAVHLVKASLEAAAEKTRSESSRCLLWLRIAQCAALEGQFELCRRFAIQAARLAKDLGQLRVELSAWLWVLALASFTDELDSVQFDVNDIERRFEGNEATTSFYLALAHFIRSQSANPLGLEAKQWLDRSQSLVDRLGAAWIRIFGRLHALFSYADRGHDKEAEEIADEIDALCRDTCLWRYQSDTAIVRAYMLYQRNHRAEAARAVQSALAPSSPCLLITWGGWFQRVISSVCEEALTDGIGLDDVRMLIERYGLRATRRRGSEWPWQIRVEMFGALRIELAGYPLLGGRKPPRKVLELLKFLVIHGPEPLSLTNAADALWPEADGDQALGSLKVSVHRLRRLLRNEAAVIVNAGRVHLSPRLIWTDVWAMRNCIDAGQPNPQAHSGSNWVQNAFDALQADPNSLMSETECAWIPAARANLRRQLEAFAQLSGMAARSEIGREADVLERGKAGRAASEAKLPS